MWLLCVAVFVVSTITNINGASYRGTNQLETKLDQIQSDVRNLTPLIEALRFGDVLQLVQHTDTTLKDFQGRFDELQKRTEIWSTHEHFITSWLDQISAVDRKLDIIIKGQDRLHKVETQLNLLHEQINRIDLDKFEVLLNTADKKQKNEKPAKNTSSNDLFSFIDEYTTRGVLSSLNRIESQVTQINKKESSENCNQLNATAEILEDISSKVDILIDKMTIPEPAIEQPAVVSNPDVTDDTVTETVTKTTNCLLDLFNKESIILLERYGNEFFQNEYLNKSFAEYEVGFNTKTAHWSGLVDLKEASKICYLKLRIELGDFEGNFAWAEYDKFMVADDGFYTLTVEGYSGNATDSFSSHNGMKFSTYDNNNDNAPECCPCAVTYGSGWWFNTCFEANLNGKFSSDPYDIDYYDGIIWEGWLGNYSLQNVRMIITSK